MNRRQLLHTGSLGALGFIAARGIPSPLGQTRASGANERIRIGIVGFSDRLRTSLLPSFMVYAEEVKNPGANPEALSQFDLFLTKQASRNETLLRFKEIAKQTVEA